MKRVDASLHSIVKPIPLTGIYPPGQHKCPICGMAVTDVRNRFISKAVGYTYVIDKLPRCLNCGVQIDWSEKRSVDYQV